MFEATVRSTDGIMAHGQRTVQEEKGGTHRKIRKYSHACNILIYKGK